MINYFKAAERLLAQRGNLEQALENLGRRRELASTQAKAERDNIKPRPYASSGGINAHTSARLELAEINREIVATRSTIAEIDRVLAQLDDADAELLRAWYIEHKSIANLLSVKSIVTITLTAVFAYLAVTNKIAQDFMTVYAVVIAFYFGTQTQREQSTTDGTQTTEEGK